MSITHSRAEVAWCLLGLTMVGGTGGCRTVAHVKEVPRVDLQLEAAGNRGYLIGTPPAPRALRATRQMLELNVEIPGFIAGVPADDTALEEVAPPEIDLEHPPAMPEAWTSPERYDTYVVQEGDSLWSIAAKPEIYGKATHWRRLFDANRDRLKTPGTLTPQMALRIPRGETPDAAADGALAK